MTSNLPDLSRLPADGSKSGETAEKRAKRPREPGGCGRRRRASTAPARTSRYHSRIQRTRQLLSSHSRRAPSGISVRRASAQSSPPSDDEPAPPAPLCWPPPSAAKCRSSRASSSSSAAASPPAARRCCSAAVRCAHACVQRRSQSFAPARRPSDRARHARSLAGSRASACSRHARMHSRSVPRPRSNASRRVTSAPARSCHVRRAAAQQSPTPTAMVASSLASSRTARSSSSSSPREVSRQSGRGKSPATILRYAANALSGIARRAVTLARRYASASPMRCMSTEARPPAAATSRWAARHEAAASASTAAVSRAHATASHSAQT